jgi:hypothetical protein
MIPMPGVTFQGQPGAPILSFGIAAQKCAFVDLKSQSEA